MVCIAAVAFAIPLVHCAARLTDPFLIASFRPARSAAICRWPLYEVMSCVSNSQLSYVDWRWFGIPNCCARANCQPIALAANGHIADKKAVLFVDRYVCSTSMMKTLAPPDISRVIWLRLDTPSAAAAVSGSAASVPSPPGYSGRKPSAPMEGAKIFARMLTLSSGKNVARSNEW